jgi:hypothetical protein
MCGSSVLKYFNEAGLFSRSNAKLAGRQIDLRWNDSFAPEAVGPEHARRESWIDQSGLKAFARDERRGGGMAEDPVCPHAPLIDANDL